MKTNLEIASENNAVAPADIFEVSGATPNFRTELAAQLAELVPEAVADGKLDVEKLRELLADDVAEGNERFGLIWPGKKRGATRCAVAYHGNTKTGFRQLERLGHYAKRIHRG